MNLVDRVKLNEGFSSVPYLCPSKRATIGYGENLEANWQHLADHPDLMTKVRRGILKGNKLVKALDAAGMKWSEDKADAVLREHLDRLSMELSVVHLGSFFNDLNQARQGVLIEMAYQMGVAGLLDFQNMLAAIRSQCWEAAAREMENSKWAKVDSPARAKELAGIMREGKA